MYIHYFFLFLLVSLNANIKAQHNLFSAASPSSIFKDKKSKILLASQLPCNAFSQNKLYFNPSLIISKQPIFCRMEDKLHQRFNVWIKLRTGSDEYYRSLITLPRETSNKLSD